MTVTQDLSFVTLITNASLLVQLVMALLLLVSAMSWTYIFRKMFAIRNATAQTAEFENAFWSGANLNALYEEVTATRRRHGSNGALERIFEAGMEEYRKARLSFSGKDVDTSALLDGARRAMRAAFAADGRFIHPVDVISLRPLLSRCATEPRGRSGPAVPGPGGPGEARLVPHPHQRRHPGGEVRQLAPSERKVELIAAQAQIGEAGGPGGPGRVLGGPGAPGRRHP